MRTHWLLRMTEENPIRRKVPDLSKLRPLFRLPKNSTIVPGSQEVRRKSPRMSIVQGLDAVRGVDAVRNARNERNNTPDSVRHSSIPHIVRPGGGNNEAGSGGAFRVNGTQPAAPPDQLSIKEDSGSLFRFDRFNLENLTAKKLLKSRTHRAAANTTNATSMAKNSSLRCSSPINSSAHLKDNNSEEENVSLMDMGSSGTIASSTLQLQQPRAPRQPPPFLQVQGSASDRSWLLQGTPKDSSSRLNSGSNTSLPNISTRSTTAAAAIVGAAEDSPRYLQRPHKSEGSRSTDPPETHGGDEGPDFDVAFNRGANMEMVPLVPSSSGGGGGGQFGCKPTTEEGQESV